jgi:endonuclease-8
MPEGPEIRRAADRIERALKDQPVDAVCFAFERLRRFERALGGHRVDAIETRGKGLLIHFDNDLSIYSHNQLYGRWYVRAAHSYPRTGRQLRLAIHNASRSALLYSASEIDVLTPAQVAGHPFLSRLGPDVVSAGTDAVLAQVSDRRFARRQLGPLLLDQGFLAGVGNYLRSEILFVAGLHPKLHPGDCSADQLAALAEAATTLAWRSYRHNGVTCDLQIARQLKAEGQSRSRYRHWVFTRAGRPCRQCGTLIVKTVVASRRLDYCPVCQPFAA